jgi:REP element-mobilizing transposase RayT
MGTGGFETRPYEARHNAVERKMIDTQAIPQRRSLRLKGYDYSQAGAYFVTVCAYVKECLFGEVIGGEMQMNELGRKVQEVWNDLPAHYPHVATGAFAVMPNHVHGVIVIGARIDTDFVRAGLKRAGLKPAPTRRHGLPEIVRAFKTFSARRINEFRGISGVPVWQRNYYEHVIRNDADYNRIAEYIANNPQRWMEDALHPDAINFSYTKDRGSP